MGHETDMKIKCIVWHYDLALKLLMLRVEQLDDGNTVRILALVNGSINWEQQECEI